MDTHDFGRLYWHIHERDNDVRVWPTAIARSEMLETPFRRGLGIGFFLPKGRKGIVLGWWGHKGGANGIRVVGERTRKIRSWGRPPTTVNLNIVQDREVPADLLKDITDMIKRQQRAEGGPGRVI